MKIVIAPDSFKGALSAPELCASVEKGIRNVVPNAVAVSIPLADGGEGTMENMVHATNGTLITAEVMNPLSQNISASYGVLGDGETVVIEVAQASGLTLISEQERNPLVTTSFGTGQLIKDALDRGYRRFIVGLGGSATNDAGMGILRALGMEFYDQHGSPIPDGGGYLSDLKRINDTRLDRRIEESTFLVACDVTNPLCGKNGASAVFGPQKGATKEMIETLDANLNHFADVILKQKGTEIRKIKGGGAAGGIAAAFVSFLNAEIDSGIDIIMEEVGFEEKIRDADLIITGEGKLDHQTLSGKVIMGVGKAAKNRDIPVLALCGQLDLDQLGLRELGILSSFSIIQQPCTLNTAFQQTADWTTEIIENLLRVIIYFRQE